MSTVEISKRMAAKPRRDSTRFVAAYYLLTILTGAFLLWFHGRLAFAVDLFVAVFYLVVTAFLYGVSTSSAPEPLPGSANRGTGNAPGIAASSLRRRIHWIALRDTDDGMGEKARAGMARWASYL